MASVRRAAVAGTFYPGEARALEASVRAHLSGATATPGPAPKALIVPHAGYVYSGPVAATAYARVAPIAADIRRVVLLGPCHRVPVRGLAVSGAEAFETPLGRIALDRDAIGGILALPQVQVFDATHAAEHSLEVHLPFLQVLLEDFTLVPLVVGDASDDEVAEVLERLWGGNETLIVISSDLSHYLDYDAARKLDAATCQAIERLEPAAIGRDQACGRIPVKGLLTVARRRNLAVSTVDLRNSGDTAGPRDRVVGYGSWVFLEPGAGKGARAASGATATAPAEGGAAATAPADPFAEKTQRCLARHGAALVRLAAASIEHGLAHGVAFPVEADGQHPELLENGASFITLKRQGQLRGCIGSALAHRPLIQDVAANGFAAAFKDPRFAAVTAPELADISLSLAVLSAPAPMTFASESDLLATLRPGIDGLIIEDEGRRALFLPAVWKTLPEPASFLGHLKVKAKLDPRHWSDAFKAWRFTAAEVSSAALPVGTALWSARADA